MIFETLNIATDIFFVFAFFGYLGWMPGLVALAKRDFALAAGDREKAEKMSKITQQNADNMIKNVNFVRHAHKNIFIKIKDFHHQTFPVGICQTGAVGRNIIARKTARRPRAAKSSTSGNDGDGEPPRRPAPLLDQSALASLLSVSKKTVQNQYSAAPWTLPPAIQIPGARGPRWTPQAVSEWLDQRPAHTPQTAPNIPKRKVGRPRIALVKQGGAA